jgi:hypothetical protein
MRQRSRQDRKRPAINLQALHHHSPRTKNVALIANLGKRVGSFGGHAVDTKFGRS